MGWVSRPFLWTLSVLMPRRLRQYSKAQALNNPQEMGNKTAKMTYRIVGMDLSPWIY
jgi:hypothetical protein